MGRWFYCHCLSCLMVVLFWIEGDQNEPLKTTFIHRRKGKMRQKVVLSGIRATGKLHLGNYLGALLRFARMSRDPAYQCLFFVADMHTLTTLKEAEMIREHAPAIVLDYLAAGVDPERSAIYVQSSIPQVAELAWYLSCLKQIKWGYQ